MRSAKATDVQRSHTARSPQRQAPWPFDRNTWLVVAGRRLLDEKGSELAHNSRDCTPHSAPFEDRVYWRCLPNDRRVREVLWMPNRQQTNWVTKPS
jgi:hypothetical protein